MNAKLEYISKIYLTFDIFCNIEYVEKYYYNQKEDDFFV